LDLDLVALFIEYNIVNHSDPPSSNGNPFTNMFL
jgi:hypothetical protein